MRVRSPALLCALLCLSGCGPAHALEQKSERGPVTATVTVEPDAPVIGDAIRLELRVRAEPGVELLMPAFGEALDRFAIVDFVPRESVDADGHTVASQRYTLQPSRSGTLAIPPLAVEFVDRRPGREPAPAGLDAWELLTERIEIEVGSVLPADAPLDLRPAKSALGPRTTPGPPLWPFALGLVALLAAAAPFAIRAWLDSRARALQRSAYQIAAAELDALLASARPGADREQMDRFFVQLSGIVRRYVENRFALRSPELTTEEFLDLMMTSPDLRVAHQRLLRDLLSRADLVKFARFVPEASAVDESVASVRVFLDDTRAVELAHG
ncbi:MAG: hypothetical protein JRG76_10055 [Deltaproteobacteria bacterium]|nr:hypothetical protein [Deltaproteobacteria bacterium]MBW2414838.1 hypothetical protein [Deltaproteobacteria bacterium]